MNSLKKFFHHSIFFIILILIFSSPLYSQNVGVGTNSPDEKLHVYNGNLLIQNYTPYLILSDTAPTNGMAGLKFRYSTTNRASFDYSIYNGYFRLSTHYTGTRPDLVIANNGRVGIGTLNPNNRLQVYGGGIEIRDSYPYLIFSDTTPTNGHAGIKFRYSTTERASLIYSIYNNYFKFSTDHTGTRPDLVVDSYGNIGIGTINPMGELHILGDTMADLYLTPNATGSSYDSQISLAEDDDNTWGMIIRYDGGTNKLNVFGKNNSTISGPHLSINRDDGYTGIGTDDPATQLHVKHETGTTHGLSLQNSYDSDRWHFYVYTGNDLGLFLNDSWRGSFNGTTGAYTYVSDRRLKKNIKPMEPITDKLMLLSPHSYHFKSQDNSDQKYLGFIAQEVEGIFPSLVHYQEETELYSLDYSGFGVLAVKAIQEQQEVITQQEKEIQGLTAVVNDLITRIEALENN